MQLRVLELMNQAVALAPLPASAPGLGSPLLTSAPGLTPARIQSHVHCCSEHFDSQKSTEMQRAEL